MSRRVRLGNDARALGFVVAQMRKFRPGMVHTHTAKAGVTGRLAAMMTRVPVRVHTFHGHLLHGYFSGCGDPRVWSPAESRSGPAHRPAGRGWEPRFVMTCWPPESALPPSTSWYHRERRSARCPTVWRSRRALGVPLDAPVVAFVGRLTQVKRLDRLLAVAQEVSRAIPGNRLLVCGDGDLAADILHAARHGDSGITALGWRADVETVYAAADLVLLTSDNEGMPVSLIEAALAGVPAVATDVGSVAEVVQHEATGILSSTSHEALARAVARLTTDEELRRDMGARARLGPRPGSARNAWHRISSSFTSRWRWPADCGPSPTCRARLRIM